MRRRAMELEVVALTDHEWRVCDARIDECDARRILGYIARVCGRYEALALDPAPRPCGAFDRLDQSIDALVDATAGPGHRAPGGV